MEEVATFCIGNPFFWAVVGMFALIGSSVTLVSKNLRKHQVLNIGFVVMFILARFMLPLPFPCSEQPRFEWGVWNTLVGVPVLLVGLVFLSAVFFILMTSILRVLSLPVLNTMHMITIGQEITGM